MQAHSCLSRKGVSCSKFDQLGRFSTQFAGSSSRATSRVVRKFDNSHDFSCNHDDLPNYFDILVVTELFCAMELLRVGMDNQSAVLKAAACAQICAITFEKNIQWLLPQRF